MLRQQPTLQSGFCCSWVGLSLLLFLSLPTWAQGAQANGQQLVRQADALSQQPGSTAQAISLYQTAAYAFHRSGEIEAEALTWHRLALVAARNGEIQTARQSAQKARVLLQVRTLPMRTAAGLSLSQAARAYLTLGRIYLESGEPQAAIDAYQTGLGRALDAKLHREAAAAYVALGLIASQAKEMEAAIRLTTNSLDLWRAAKDFGGEAVALNNLARFYERSGDSQSAADYDAAAIQVTRFSRNYNAESESLREAMRLHLLLGNHDEAAAACEQLIGLARLKRDAAKEAEQTITLAMIEAQRDHLPSAFRLLLKAFLVAPQSDREIKGWATQFAATMDTRGPESRDALLTQAEQESSRGDYAAAYQLLLRALLANEGQSDVTNAALNARIKTLTRQIEAQQKKLSVTRPERFD